MIALAQKWERDDDSRRLVAGGDFVLDEPETIPAVWGDGERVLWPEGEGVMITGHQGVGKTTIGQQLVLHRVGLSNGAVSSDGPTATGCAIVETDGRRVGSATA